MRLHLLVDVLRRLTQRQLAQRGELLGPEEVLERALGLLRDVDLAVAQALEQLLGREVDQPHLVGAVEDPVGHRLAHAHAGDLRDHVVQALEVLDVDGRPHLDARIEQLLDVEVALRVARARRIGVGELVDDRDRGAALEQGVEIHLGQRLAAIGDRVARDHLESLEQLLGIGAPVRLDDADHHLAAFGTARLCGLEHRVGLADAGRRADEQAEAAALCARGGLDQRVGRRAAVVIGLAAHARQCLTAARGDPGRGSGAGR